jgi:hypothetical protein
MWAGVVVLGMLIGLKATAAAPPTPVALLRAAPARANATRTVPDLWGTMTQWAPSQVTSDQIAPAGLGRFPFMREVGGRVPAACGREGLI